jgi:peptide/nickel transport system ATP-binding protein
MSTTQATSSLATETVLRINDLTVEFATESGTVPAVRGVSLSVRAGETLALVGESGSGKSTIALAAMGLLSGNATAHGTIDVSGINVVGSTEPSLREIRGKDVAMVFQEPSTALNPLMRVGEQVAEAVRNHRPMSAKDAAVIAVELLRKVGIPDPAQRARSFPFQLSGGQRQRIVIAMAIANEPRLLIADEPTTALDVTVQAEILDLLRTLATETGTGVLLVTHNMGVVADFADRVAVMYHGEIVETGTVEDVLLRPEHEYTSRLLSAVPRLLTSDAVAGSASSTAPTNATPNVTVKAPGTTPPAPTAETVLSLANVSVTYGSRSAAVHALDDVSITVSAGETVGLVGESGSGKSTAARVALGLVSTRAGTVELFGTDLKRAGLRARRRLQAGVGVVLQDPVTSLDPRMSVGEAVAEPLEVHLRLSSRDRDERVRRMLEAVHLPSTIVSRAPQELSGGQRQRVSIARALILEPRLLVADEPTSALDVSVQETVLQVLDELQERLGFACLFVSHDLAVVQRIAHRVVVMRSGRVEEQGLTTETLLHPQTEYTRGLLAAVPVPDPIEQRERRAARQIAMAAAGMLTS